MRRAQAAKDYLGVSGGLDAAKISAVGKSESAPVTNPEDCKGSNPNARLPACNPDRRVEVVVSSIR